MAEPQINIQKFYTDYARLTRMRVAAQQDNYKDFVSKTEMRREFSTVAIGKLEKIFDELYAEQTRIYGREVRVAGQKMLAVEWLNRGYFANVLKEFSELAPAQRKAYLVSKGIDPRHENEFVATMGRVEIKLAELRRLQSRFDELNRGSMGWAVACAKSPDVISPLLLQLLIGVISPPQLISTTPSGSNVTANTPIMLLYRIGANFDPRIVDTLTKDIKINGVTVNQSDISVVANPLAGTLAVTITNSVNSNYTAAYIAANGSVPNKYNYYNYSNTGASVSVVANLSSPHFSSAATANFSFNMGRPIPSLASISISDGTSVNPAGSIVLRFNMDGYSSSTSLVTLPATGLSNLRLKGNTIAFVDQSTQGTLENAGISLDQIQTTVTNLSAYGFVATDTNQYFEYQLVDTNLNGTVPSSGTAKIRINGTGAGYTATYASDSPLGGTATYDPATDTIIVTFNVAPAGFTDGSTVTFNAGEITINGTNVAPADVAFWGSAQGAPANQFQVRINNNNGTPRKYIGYGQTAAVNINLTSQSTFGASVVRLGYVFGSIADTRPTLNIPAVGASVPNNASVVVGPVANYTLDFSTAGGAAGDLADLQNNSTFEVSTNGGAWVTVALGGTLAMSSMGGNNFRYVHTPAGGFTTGNTYAFRVTTLNSATRVQPASFTRYFTVEKPMLQSTTMTSNPAEGAAIASTATDYQFTFNTVDTNANAIGAAGDETDMLANLTATYSTDNGATWNAAGGTTLNITSLGGNQFRADVRPAGDWPATSNVLVKLDFGAGATKIAPVTVVRAFTTP